MMWSEKQTGAFTLQPLVYGLYFFRQSFFTRGEMVQPQDEQRIAVIEDAFIDRLLVSGLVDALKNGDRMSRAFTSDLLKAQYER